MRNMQQVAAGVWAVIPQAVIRRSPPTSVDACSSRTDHTDRLAPMRKQTGHGRPRS